MLQRFVELCHESGLSKITICYAQMPSEPARAMLESLSKSISVDILTPEQPQKGDEGPSASRENSTDNELASVEYVVQLPDLESALDHVNRIAVLIGASIPLDEQCLARLEFCLHELVANVVEHGAFKTPQPEIRVELLIPSDWVHVVYSDNSSAFRPADRLNVDMPNKIKEGHKRGFGIFLLHRITEDLKHERKNEQNKVTFRLKRDIQSQEA